MGFLRMHVSFHHLSFARSFLPIVSICLAVATATGRTITSNEAARATEAWLSRDPAPFDSAIGSRMVQDVRTAKDENGGALFHVVRLKGGGVVVTSAESGISPVIAFTESNDIDEHSSNPLWNVLNADLKGRMSWVSANRSPNGIGTKLLSLVSASSDEARGLISRAESAWDALLSEGQDSQTVRLRAGGHANGARAVKVMSLNSISEVRVSPLIKSAWGQTSTTGLATDPACYNLYVPNDYPCGCTITAIAQLFRYHRFPTGNISPQTRTCKIDGVEVQETMFGGVYNWNDMPLKPSFGITATQCEEIGKLCFDLGVATEVGWKDDGSGAGYNDAYNAIKDIFVKWRL